MNLERFFTMTTLLVSGWVVALSVSLPAVAGPRSYVFPTNTEATFHELGQIKSLAWSVGGLATKLRDELLLISDADCLLVGETCAEAANAFLSPLIVASYSLSEKADYYFRNLPSDYEAAFEDLRQNYFNQIAWQQWYFIRGMRDIFSIGGSGRADIACQDFLDVYWVLMNQIVAYPRAAGLADGRGVDDDD